MTHGERDYTNTTAVKVVSAKIDFDLPVILVDRFENANFLWRPGGVPADYDAHMEAGAAYEGSAGVALRTSLAAVGVGESATIDRYAFTTPSKKLSYSTLFRINQDHSFVESIHFTIGGSFNGLNYITDFRYRAADEAWDYQDDAANWIEFITGIRQDDDHWQRVYFEIDMDAPQHISFETSDRRVNLTGIAIRTAPLAPEYLYTAIRVYNAQIGTPADVSIDSVIIKEIGG